MDVDERIGSRRNIEREMYVRMSRMSKKRLNLLRTIKCLLRALH